MNIDFSKIQPYLNYKKLDFIHLATILKMYFEGKSICMLY